MLFNLLEKKTVSDYWTFRSLWTAASNAYCTYILYSTYIAYIRIPIHTCLHTCLHTYIHTLTHTKVRKRMFHSHSHINLSDAARNSDEPCTGGSGGNASGGGGRGSSGPVLALALFTLSSLLLGIVSRAFVVAPKPGRPHWWIALRPSFSPRTQLLD